MTLVQKGSPYRHTGPLNGNPCVHINNQTTSYESSPEKECTFSRTIDPSYGTSLFYCAPELELCKHGYKLWVVGMIHDHSMPAWHTLHVATEMGHQ